MSRLIKHVGIAGLRAVGPHLPTAWLRRSVALRHSSCLMDERVLPRGAVPRKIRGGPTVLCDPYIYVHRLPYWTGHLHEEELETYMRAAVRPGDTVLDVGANYGHFTVLAAHLVGDQGRVYAFEPIPHLVKMLGDHLAKLALERVEILPFALGSERGSATLHVSRGDEGVSTLRQRDASDSDVVVSILPGDEVLESRPMPGRTFLKLDVEGFELEALLGLRRTLSAHVDHAVIEVTPAWLGQDGVDRLFSLLASCGLQPSSPTAAEALRTGGASDDQCNVLFTREK